MDTFAVEADLLLRSVTLATAEVSTSSTALSSQLAKYKRFTIFLGDVCARQVGHCSAYCNNKDLKANLLLFT